MAIQEADGRERSLINLCRLCACVLVFGYCIVCANAINIFTNTFIRQKSIGFRTKHTPSNVYVFSVFIDMIHKYILYIREYTYNNNE